MAERPGDGAGRPGGEAPGGTGRPQGETPGGAPPPKRKQRGGGEHPMSRGYAKAEQRNQEAREALRPLGEGERPLVVTIGAVLAALVALSIIVGYASGAKVNGEAPRFAQVAAPVLILTVMAWGMWRARYWAVLGFQLLLVFLMFAAFSGLLISASTAPQFLATGLLLAVAAALFFFMVKAMARIQMPERRPRD